MRRAMKKMFHDEWKTASRGLSAAAVATRQGGVKSNFWAVNDQRVIVVVIVDRFQNFAGHRHGV